MEMNECKLIMYNAIVIFSKLFCIQELIFVFYKSNHLHLFIVLVRFKGGLASPNPAICYIQ